MIGNVDELMETIELIIDKKLKKEQEKYAMFQKYFWVGEVDVVDNTSNTATILLPTQTIATASKQNKSNQTLVNGDEVLLFSPYGTLGSSFILIAYKQYV